MRTSEKEGSKKRKISSLKTEQNVNLSYRQINKKQT
jgi:hypothetical protein